MSGGGAERRRYVLSVMPSHLVRAYTGKCYLA